MVVKNLNRTEASPCGCGSWLAHWHNFGHPSQGFAQRQTCAVVVCPNPISVGAHVQKEVLEGRPMGGMRGDASWYVVPLCQDCCQKLGGVLIVEDDCGLAPANVSETCGSREVEDRPLQSA